MWRTIKGGDAHLRLRDWIITAIATVVLPAICGFVLSRVALFFIPAPPPQSLGDYIVGGLVSLSVAPFATLFAIVPCIFIGAVALRVGWGGWASALTLPSVLIAVVLTFIAQLNVTHEPETYMPLGILLVGNAIVHAATMWLCIRFLRPAAVAPRLNQSEFSRAKLEQQDQD